jgi:hypothetical protein
MNRLRKLEEAGGSWRKLEEAGGSWRKLEEAGVRSAAEAGPAGGSKGGGVHLSFTF